MTNQEFSNEFDVLYNSITSNAAPGLDEYEKSVFLTKAQNEAIQSYFNPRENKVQQGFDGSRKRQMDFSSLIRTATLKVDEFVPKFDDRSVSYRIPRDLLLFINESCKDKNFRYVVIPISFEEYDRLMSKPYQYPIKRGIWRLIVDTFPSIGKADKASLSIENRSDKTVTVIIKTVTSDKILTDFGTPTTSPEGIISHNPTIGVAPIVEEYEDSVTIIMNIVTGKESSRYWSTFLRIGVNTPTSYLKAIMQYVGDFSAKDSSIFPSLTVSSSPNTEVCRAVADPIAVSTELIGRVDKDTLTYTVRYLRKPRPIILTDLEGGLSIQGISKVSTCELDESLHSEILQRAVELAKASYTGDLASQIALGQSSQTDIGIVSQSSRQ